MKFIIISCAVLFVVANAIEEQASLERRFLKVKVPKIKVPKIPYPVKIVNDAVNAIVKPAKKVVSVKDALSKLVNSGIGTVVNQVISFYIKI